jgi:hypothetical protein
MASFVNYRNIGILSSELSVMTLIACGPGSMDNEYLLLLSDVKSAAFENEQLILYSENSSEKMFFTNGGRAEQKV